MKTALVALGGNSLLRPEDRGTVEEQLEHMRTTCSLLADMVEEGYELVLTHGNGPQVGNILLQNDIASGTVPRMPLDICVAQTQGQIGYLFQRTLKNELIKRGMKRDVCSLITQVVVHENDPAFENPTKFVGPYYSKEEAERLKKEKDWKMGETADKKYRRIVPSPEPKKIIESPMIKELIFSGDKGYIVIAAGGGGVPVIEKDGDLRGIEGVIDKDLASAVLAEEIGETFYIMLTRPEQVYLNFGKEEQEAISEMTISEAKRYYEEGQFPPGSMGPKIQASIRFLENGGERVLITSPECLREALKGDNGTYIYSDRYEKRSHKG